MAWSSPPTYIRGSYGREYAMVRLPILLFILFQRCQDFVSFELTCGSRHGVYVVLVLLTFHRLFVRVVHSTDGWYLDSVLNTEDGSHPDRDMVLLWCMRNGLTHCEVSALDGTCVIMACLLTCLDVTVSFTHVLIKEVESMKLWNV
jgi:hypothetical protein